MKYFLNFMQNIKKNYCSYRTLITLLFIYYC